MDCIFAGEKLCKMENEKRDLLVEVHSMVTELHEDYQFVKKHRNMLFGNPVLEFSEVCSKLRLSERQVRYLRQTGELVGFLFGRRRLYAQEEVDDFVARMKAGTVQPKSRTDGRGSR